MTEYLSKTDVRMASLAMWLLTPAFHMSAFHTLFTYTSVYISKPVQHHSDPDSQLLDTTLRQTSCLFCTLFHSLNRTLGLLVHPHLLVVQQRCSSSVSQSVYKHYYDFVTHNGHLLILPHSPTLKEALSNFIDCKHKFSLYPINIYIYEIKHIQTCLYHSHIHIAIHPYFLQILHRMFRCLAQPLESCLLVLGTSPAMSQR